MRHLSVGRNESTVLVSIDVGSLLANDRHVGSGCLLVHLLYLAREYPTMHKIRCQTATEVFVCEEPPFQWDSGLHGRLEEPTITPGKGEELPASLHADTEQPFRILRVRCHDGAFECTQ